LPKSRPKEVAPENWHGPAQPRAHAHKPTKNTAAAQEGSAVEMYCAIPTSGNAASGTTVAAATPTMIPSNINGAPRIAARSSPFWPSSGLRADIDIWKAAWANGTLTMNVPNQTTIKDTPALEISNICGCCSARVCMPLIPGETKNAQIPTTYIAKIMKTFIV